MDRPSCFLVSAYKASNEDDRLSLFERTYADLILTYQKNQDMQDEIDLLKAKLAKANDVCHES